jgi:hypothetical protein
MSLDKYLLKGKAERAFTHSCRCALEQLDFDMFEEEHMNFAYILATTRTYAISTKGFLSVF